MGWAHPCDLVQSLRSVCLLDVVLTRYIFLACILEFFPLYQLHFLQRGTFSHLKQSLRVVVIVYNRANDVDSRLLQVIQKNAARYEYWVAVLGNCPSLERA